MKLILKGIDLITIEKYNLKNQEEPKMDKAVFMKTLGNIKANTFKLLDKIEKNINYSYRQQFTNDVMIIQEIMLEFERSSPIYTPNHYTANEITEFEKKITNLLNMSASNLHGEILVEDWEAMKKISDELIPFYRVAKLYNDNNKSDEELKDLKKYVNESIVEIKKEFELNILKILEKESAINIIISKTNSMIKELTSSHNDILTLTNEVRDEYAAFEKGNLQIDNLLSKSNAAVKNIDNIKNILSTAESSMKALHDKGNSQYNDFNKKITSTTKEINELITNSRQISELKKNVEHSINHSKELIKNSERAMSLSGTYRLSRSFKAAYLISVKSRDAWKIISILSAMISFIFVGFMLYEMYAFDYYKISSSTTPAIMMFFARFSMLPVILGFFVFSAMQYVKQNNICEDYAHKKLLSETLISFKDELTNSSDDKTTNYLKETLKEILRSPLSSINKTSHKEELTHINKILSTTNEIQNKLLDTLKKPLKNEGNEK